MDEEERQRMVMMKIKRWMTEILLGVTNEEISSVCQEVYFETKRSAKTKAQVLVRSGGLSALCADAGDASSNESESEDEEKPAFRKPPTPKKAKSNGEISKQKAKSDEN